MPNAIANAYRNNCSFHCIIHTLFSKNEQELTKLFKKYPLLQDIMFATYQHYDLPFEEINLDNFIRLLNRFSHPVDREILLGQVLRTVLRDQINNNQKATQAQKKELLNGHLVSDEVIAQFAKQLGASVIIHSEYDNPDFDLKYPLTNAVWQLELFHKTDGGGHYDFSYGEEFLNESHNSQYQPLNEWNQRLPKGVTLLYEKSNIVGVKKQDEQMKKVVQQEYKDILEHKRRFRHGS